MEVMGVKPVSTDLSSPAKAFTSKALVTPHSSYMEITRKSSKYKIQYKIALIVTKPEP